MQFSFVEQQLFQTLHKALATHGFELLADLKQFRKNTPIGFQNIILSLTSYQDSFYLDVNIGVRIQMVEDIAQQFINETEADYRPHVNTLIISIGKLTDSQYFRYRIAEHDDIQNCCDEIIDFLNDIGFDFLERVSHHNTVNELMNKYPNFPVKYLYNQIHRCFKAIIIARICNHSSFLTLMGHYSQLLMKLNATRATIVNYERLCNYLLRYTVN